MPSENRIPYVNFDDLIVKFVSCSLPEYQLYAVNDQFTAYAPRTPLKTLTG